MWRPVAGASGAEIFALTNKPPITNSNAYLIRTATRILIIDPSTEPAQIARINELVAESQTAGSLTAYELGDAREKCRWPERGSGVRQPGGCDQG
ncbi:hypothetical protein G3545_07805 [Starkeya sp. ORNL1]|uniref:hypothetical protein n=1 Tax=Starkeya sp. ORNL1 TaxID=2709380 RepID=UPI001463DB27|nr:hypothetical protein [Starkeya sp. ORNL1]QJP13567.1 hypothetical protein G3545_07805 [Starkeya sp. ORNL1]